ncbi:MAG TPA: hypothetical protein VGN20_11020 [Mucilaginibacter sp.]|jgi:hypothetical protein
MKPSLLFPSYFRIIGVILLFPGLILGYIFIFLDQVIAFLDYDSGNLTDEVATTLIVSGLILIGFSRLKNESNETAKLRLVALYWSVLADGVLSLFYWILLFFVEIHKLQFSIKWLNFDLSTYNLFILLVIFIARYYYTLNRFKKGKKAQTLYFLPTDRFGFIWKIMSALFFSLIVADVAFPSMDQMLKLLLLDDVIILLPFCLLMSIWSREKSEIVLIKNLRFRSMQMAVYINYSLLLAATWLVYGGDYLLVQLAGLVSLPIIFLIIFYYQLYRVFKTKKLGYLVK